MDVLGTWVTEGHRTCLRFGGAENPGTIVRKIKGLREGNDLDTNRWTASTWKSRVTSRRALLLGSVGLVNVEAMGASGGIAMEARPHGRGKLTSEGTQFGGLALASMFMFE